jgi:hypothetical protein
MSATGRARIAAAQRARWAKVKGPKVVSITAAKRTMSPAVNAARADIAVDLASLYHHYSLDSYGRTPPGPDPAQFEYLKFVLPAKEFRLSGDGVGISTAKQYRTAALQVRQSKNLRMPG